MSSELVHNGFEGASETNVAVSEVGALAAIAREEGLIKAGCAMAKRFPRNEEGAFTKLMKSMTRPSMAENASYSFPRGGQTVSGPSVDLAREAARCWGNVRYGLLIVSLDEQVHIKGYALDMESNSYVECEDKFAKLVQRKNRKTGVTEWISPDERDLRELVNRRGAILVRNAILQVLPPDVIDEARVQASATLQAAANGELKGNKTDAIRRLVLNFDALGVSVEMLERKLGHKLDVITAEEIVELKAIGKSILDGNSRRDEHFHFPENGKEQSPEASDLQAKIDARKKTAKQEPVVDEASDHLPRVKD